MPDTALDGLAVSTVWVRAEPKRAALEPKAVAAEMLDRLAASGLGAVELEYRLTAAVLEALLPELKFRGIRPVSLHNFVPVPDILAPDQASGDAFNLSSLDPDERRLAVDYTVRSLELASDLEVGALVVHLGWVAGIEDKKVIRRAAEQGGSPELDEQLRQREALAPAHLDAVSFSLERLARAAEPLGVTLGLENRYHAYQMPGFAELALLFERFAGGPFGYWHDMGHARVSELAGLQSQVEYLEAYGSLLLGAHLHDARGWRDHQLPGSGEMDWEGLAPLLAASPRLVLEVAQDCTPAELGRAAAELARIFSAARQARQEGK